MQRRLTLIVLFSLLGIVGTLYGPVAIRLATDLLEEFRGMRELARQQRYLEEHPPEPPFIRLAAGVILRAAGARAVRVCRLNTVRDTTCAGECFLGHAVIGSIPVQGMDWGRTFLEHVMRMATVPRSSEDLSPRFGIRFIGAADTTDVLLDTTNGPGDASLLFQWRDPSGRLRGAMGHMPFPFEGDPDADSTLRLLRRLPQPN